jgi:FkbM family methyltransferase
MYFINLILQYFKIFYEIFFRSKILVTRKSYGFEFEDITINKYLKNIKKGFYVDIGAFNPIRGSNTYLLFKKGWSGINVDADENSIKIFNILRRKDYNFNYAISSSKKKELKLYYEKNSSGVKTTVTKFRDLTLKKFKFKKVKVSTFKSLIKKTKYYKKRIDFLNIDCEGNDFDVLKSVNIKTYKPKIICIEINILLKKSVKKSSIYKYLYKNNYELRKSFLNSHIFAYKE